MVAGRTGAYLEGRKFQGKLPGGLCRGRCWVMLYPCSLPQRNRPVSALQISEGWLSVSVKVDTSLDLRLL